MRGKILGALILSPKKGRQQGESLFLWAYAMEVTEWPSVQQCVCLSKGRGRRWAQAETVEKTEKERRLKN